MVTSLSNITGKKEQKPCFPIKSFLDCGVRACRVLLTIRGALSTVAGRTVHGYSQNTLSGDLIGPGQRISIDEAFKMYTVCAAYASFEEYQGPDGGSTGRPGVLDRDPWTIRPEPNRDQIGVDMTILAGKWFYRRE